MNTIKSAGNKSAASWRVAKGLLGIGKKDQDLPLLEGCSTNQECAEKYNRFILDKVASLRPKQVGDLSKNNTNQSEATPKFDLHCVGINTIKRAVRRLKTTGAEGNDGIPVFIIKRCLNSLAPVLTDMVNHSISTGHVPSTWKLARVVPVYKGKNKNPLDPASYRPVSILPCISKVLESVIAEQLIGHLDQHDLLPREQHGFRPCRSTVTALLEAMSYMTEGLEVPSKHRAVYRALVMFDYSQAFDTLDPKILEAKMQSIGASDRTIKWMGSYLSGGRRSAVWNGAVSSVLDVVTGVPQGSVLGPLLYILMTTDVPRAVTSTGARAVAYADDTSGISEAPTPLQIQESIGQIAGNMISTANYLGLALNMGKTEIMPIKPPGDFPSQFDLGHGLQNINTSDQVCLLGLTINHRLSPKPHLENLICDLSKRVGIIRRAAKRVTKGVLIMLAQGLVLSKLQTYTLLWYHVRLEDEDGVADSLEQKLQISLNDTARIILGKKRSDRVKVKELLNRTNLPSLNQICFRAAATEGWKMANQGTLSHLYETLTVKGTTRSATAGMMATLPEKSCNIGMRNISKVWNSSKEIREAKSVAQVKKIAKSLSYSLPI